MASMSAEQLRVAVGYFVPVELQRRNLQCEPVFGELATRSFKMVSESDLQQIQPWCKWRGITTYLDCLAFADRAARELPKGPNLGLQHVTPGQFYAAGEIFFAQAMIDNIASWLCEALPMAVAGGERNFGKVAFVRQLEQRPGANELLHTHKGFVKEVNRYRQVWIHTLAGGVIPLVDDDPFLNPQGANRHLGVPIDPAINVDEPGYMKRVEECAKQNEGRYCYAIDEFTQRIFEGAWRFYLGWLHFSLFSY